ncbi:hypothetical protein [Salsipaludibacter albus]|uniref:hypothetical protein n=1 Tax=Salsipaludibacter albus TaxID=2849650 RepID=UPI001EE4DBCF|nr:hypothetical protein [Salsipaludibacter albus]MBY5164192.1 hypothetical protein [Salsipaludibacter albus]
MPPPPVAAGWSNQPPPPGGGGRLERSMTVGDVIEAMFTLLRSTFGTVAAVAAILLVPGLVLVITSLTQVEEIFSAASVGPDGAFTLGSGSGIEPLFVILLVLGGLLSLVGSAAAVPATMQVGVDHWNDVTPRVGRALAVGFRRMWGIITVWLALWLPLAVLFALPGLFALVAEEPAWLALYFVVLPVVAVLSLVAIMVGYLVPAAVVAEEIGAWQALRRVRTLLRGTFWPTFGRGLLIGFLLGIVNSVLGFVSSFLGFLPPEVIIVLAIVTNLVSFLVLTPLGNYGGLALYGDLRIRSEGSDVLAMASRLRG